MHPKTVGRRAGQEPLRHAQIATDPVPVITVVDIRETLEACRQSLASSRFAQKTLSLCFQNLRHDRQDDSHGRQHRKGENSATLSDVTC
jgi:hypothetical protein